MSRHDERTMRFGPYRTSDERGPVPGSPEEQVSRVVRAIADLFRPQPSLRIP
jgi:hypothetical protein